ncbi:MAG: HD domain-containing phosphohydrolase [Bacillota bacterium]
MRFNNAPVGIIHFDIKGDITDCNDSYTRLTGTSRDTVIGLNLLELPDKRIATAVQKAFQGYKGTFEGKYKFTASGKEAYLWAQFSPVSKDDPGAGFIGMIEDISERKQVEEKVRAKQFRDTLTNLYNRSYILEEMIRLNTPRQLPISIILADLGGLDMVNNAFGSTAGDKMLTIAAEVLKAAFRSEDILARLESDKFVILLPQTNSEETNVLIRRIAENAEKSSVEKIPLTFTTGASTKQEPEQDIITVLNEAEADLYKNKLLAKNNDINATVIKVMQILSETGYETLEHLEQMKHMARQIGERLELSGSELERLDTAINVHDIGKISISEQLLAREKTLTKNQWEAVMRHPETGYKLLEGTEEMAYAAYDVLAHHEHWDGKGYPQGLKGPDIPLASRIIAIADAFEVMKSGRPYKKAMTPEQVIAELNRCSGTQFDPELVKIAVEFINSRNKPEPSAQGTGGQGS